jgi:hypothetical protein
MKVARPSQRRHYTTTNLMAKTRSRYDPQSVISTLADVDSHLDHVCKEVNAALDGTVMPACEEAFTVPCISPFLLERLNLHSAVPTPNSCQMSVYQV